MPINLTEQVTTMIKVSLIAIKDTNVFLIEKAGIEVNIWNN
jgi:hypothetical protein